jgi:hypothetical protein
VKCTRKHLEGLISKSALDSLLCETMGGPLTLGSCNHIACFILFLSFLLLNFPTGPFSYLEHQFVGIIGGFPYLIPSFVMWDLYCLSDYRNNTNFSKMTDFTDI